MGLWSNTFDRARNGEKRTEDLTKIDIYLKNVEWIDMGNRNILFAKHDFPLEYLHNDEKLSLNDIKEIMESLPDDVSIITKSQILWLKDNCKVVKYKTPERKNDILESSICCISEKTNEDIHFNLCMTNGGQEAKYFLKFLKKSSSSISQKIEYTGIGPMKFPSYLGTPKAISVYNESKFEEKLYNIKLVKLK